MKKLFIYILLLLILSSVSIAQPTENIYLGSVIKSGYADDSTYGPFNIGFNFIYFGNPYSQFYINSNGQVLFGAGSASSSEVVIPTAGAPDNYIAPFWDDLVVDGTGKILYTTIGASPNRRLIIQFNNMGFYGVPSFMGSFFVILNETSNTIQFQYRLVVNNISDRAHGSSASIGLENSDGSSGVQYLFQTSGDINTGKAILFTPSAGSYTINADAIYEWIYLTTNTTLPEPSIPILSSPSLDPVIGSDYTFEWSESANIGSYSLMISTSSDLGGGMVYFPGTNTSYDVTGLAINTTYYWGVFATNTTGTTWCEIKRFTTSSAPPLAAIPQTIWIEQSQEKTIKLNYSGGDASAKTAIITSLPAQGQLYQYNAGVKGTLISSFPTDVTDPNRNVIYVANGSSGNGAGNFNFKIHDDTGDSPEALITVNVSSPGMPNLLYTGKATTYVELQFDRTMANPAGKEGQFTITVNSSPATISSLSLKTGDPYTIIATLSSPIAITDAVTIAYTAGNITSTSGGLLASFDAQTASLLAQTITFTTNLSKKFNESPFTLAATASSGLSMTYSSSNQTVATISGNSVTLKSVGTSDITARQAGNGTYAPARYIRTLSVAKGDQTITFDPLPDKIYGDADFTISAVASSGLQVAWLSSNTDVAAITGNTVHIAGAGTTTITASQAGNSLWNAAPDVPRTQTVNKADQTITFDPLPDKETDDPDFSPGATASSGLNVSYSSDNLSVATIVSDMIHIVDAGTSNITASQSGNTNYNAASDVIQPLTVSVATGLEIHAASSKSFIIYPANNLINIQTLDNEWSGQQGSVRVFNLIGNPVNDLQNVELTRNSLVQIPSPAVKGLYVVEIRSGVRRYVGKVVVR